MDVESWDPVAKKFVPWKFKPAGKAIFYWMTSDLDDNPMSVEGGDIHYDTVEEARIAGLEALDKMDEGLLEIWTSKQDAMGNGESEVLLEYRREKKGPSVTTEVPSPWTNPDY